MYLQKVCIKISEHINVLAVVLITCLQPWLCIRLLSAVTIDQLISMEHLYMISNWDELSFIFVVFYLFSKKIYQKYTRNRTFWRIPKEIYQKWELLKDFVWHIFFKWLQRVSSHMLVLQYDWQSSPWEVWSMSFPLKCDFYCFNWYNLVEVMSYEFWG